MGNEFGSVEALWSQFEAVMGHDPNGANEEEKSEGGDENEHDEEHEGERSEEESSRR